MADDELNELLQSRCWWTVKQPFPHIRAADVFRDAFYGELERELEGILARGLAQSTDPSRFSKNMMHSDAYGWDFPPDISGALAIFYSPAWHNLLCSLTGAHASGDVNGALHHHHAGSNWGAVHRDLGLAWFSDQQRPDGINPMDLTRCSYAGPLVHLPGVRARPRVRAITMIFYLANRPWNPRFGGETGLYNCTSDDVRQPVARIPPIDNSLVVFENTPASYHAFMQNRGGPRNSVVLWLHRTYEDAALWFGESAIGRW